MSAFTDKLKARAKENIKTIALAEGEDIRTLKAADCRKGGLREGNSRG